MACGLSFTHVTAIPASECARRDHRQPFRQRRAGIRQVRKQAWNSSCVAGFGMVLSVVKGSERTVSAMREKKVDASTFPVYKGRVPGKRS